MIVSYQWLQDRFFDGALPRPGEVADALTFGAFEIEGVEEREGDTLIDVDVLPNRASDSLSHRGIAREIATLLDIPMARDPIAEQLPILEQKGSALAVAVESAASCPVYLSARIRGVRVGPSPAWLQRYLEAVGQRPINAIVDATNFVMLEIGTPLHAFDAAKLTERDGVGIHVRSARKAEQITALGGGMYELAEHMTVIADMHSDEALAIAGVKGGTKAEVDAGTTDIILEAAKFDPVQTRKTAQALKIRTDASQRFENEISDLLPVHGMHALCQLILDIAGGKLTDVAFSPLPKKERGAVSVHLERANRLLGTSLDGSAVRNIFDRLGFAYEEDGGTFSVTPPFERLDITQEADLVEEIGRVYGYQNVPSALLPPVAHERTFDTEYWIMERIRRILVEREYQEVYTYALREKGEVMLANALASDKGALRTDVHEGIRKAMDKAQRHLPLTGLDTVRMFEIGHVFSNEGERLAVGIGFRPPAGKTYDARIQAELDGVAQALKEGLDTPDLPCAVHGDVLTCDLSAVSIPVDISQYDSLPHIAPGTAYQPFSVYPFVLRDIALWVPEGTTPNDILLIITNEAGDLLVRTDQFDEYHKDGRISYAFHLVFQSSERTLSDAEVGEIMHRVEEQLRKAGFEIR